MPKYPENLFAQIYERASTKAERARLMRIKAALGLSDRDEFWPLLLVLDHYLQWIEAARRALVADVDNAIIKHAHLMKQAGGLADEKASRAVAKAIAESTDKIAAISEAAIQSRADEMSNRALRRAALLGGALAVCLMGAAALVTYGVMALNGICAGPDRYLTPSGPQVCEVTRLPFST